MTDLSRALFQVAELFDDVKDSYWFCNELLRDLVDEHAPMKQRIVKHNQMPYMNSQLNKAINVRNMFRRKFDRSRYRNDWEIYRQQRNYVAKLRKSSKNKYLSDRCSNCKNGNDFWDTVKPLLSTKNRGADCDIVFKGE